MRAGTADHMILCSICRRENHHFATTCASCGGYLQNRTENLDLFATAWGVIERPLRTFRLIALSRRKNFAPFVAALAGIGLTFGLFWSVAAGEHTENAASLFIAGIVVGPFAGIALVLFYSLLVKAMTASRGSTLRFGNAFAVYSYALVPVVLTVIFLLPVEIIAFGRFFFTNHPTPYSLSPVVYVCLIGLDALCAAWTLSLLAAGTKVLLDASWKRSLVLFGLPLLLLAAGIAGGVRILLPGGGS